MKQSHSTEALARRAVQVRADDDARLREFYGESAPQPRRSLDDELPAFKARFAALTPRVAERSEKGAADAPAEDPRVIEAVLDASRAERVLMAEGVVLLGCARSVSGHRKHVLESKGGQSGMPTLAPIALRRRLRLAREGGDRRAMVEVIEKAEDDDRKPAIQLVDALRAADDVLGGGLLTSIGWVSTDARALAESVLAITEDPYAELRRGRIQGALGRGARATVLAEHGALSRTERADDAMPLPDREGIASRWCERLDLGLPRLVGGVPSPAVGHPLRLLAGDPLVSARAIGAPAPDAHGVLELMTFVGELLTLRTAGAGPIADALGVSRLHGASIATLARQLSLRPAFLLREAAIDRSRIEDVLRELLYVELERLRTLAAETLALSDALERTPGLGERVAETFGKALGFDCAPGRAPHRVCDAWHAQAPRWLEAAVHASALGHALVERHDEDFFRNPRAGEMVRSAIDSMRVLGAGPVEVEALRRMVDSCYRDANA